MRFEKKEDPILIGFGYKRLRGKDTAAKFAAYHLETSYGKCRHDQFAKSLKTGIGQYVFGLTHDQLYDQTEKLTVDPFWGKTPREILQLSGTDALRDVFGADVWVKTLERRWRQDKGTHVVISDVRFLNEVEAIKSWGGYVIRVDRDTPFEKGVDDHRSETELDSYDDWDAVIDNNGTKAELQSNLFDVIDGFVGHRKKTSR